MFYRIIYSLIIFLISITFASAAVTELQISPDNPVVGDTITISGVASSPGESINTEISFTKLVAESGGFYSYNINDVEIPSGSNSFTVTATGVDDLNVDIKMSIWLSRSISASGGTATLKESNLSEGTYDVQIYGRPASGVSTVSIQITATQIIVADSDGNFEYDYATNALPVGDFELIVGGVSRTITLNAPSSNVEKSSSGGFASTSGEAAENILFSEVKSEFVNIDSEISYSFNLEGNIIRNINFTGLTNSGTVVARVEILKNTSTLVDNDPPDIVYKNLNIWIGNSGWATSKNIVDPRIYFIVKKTWINENNIDEGSIRLNRYSEGKWNPLETTEIDEDFDYLYFMANTPGFSPFAITGQKKQTGDLQPTINIVLTQSESKSNTSQNESETKSHRAIPGFDILIAVIGLSIIIFVNRK